MTAKITKIENGLVYAKSDNPLGERRPTFIQGNNPDSWELSDNWQAAESERIELQILEQSILDGHIPFIGKEIEVKQDGKYFKII